MIDFVNRRDFIKLAGMGVAIFVSRSAVSVGERQLDWLQADLKQVKSDALCAFCVPRSPIEAMMHASSRGASNDENRIEQWAGADAWGINGPSNNRPDARES